MSAFKKATKEGLFLRVCLCGPSGSGKTFTALSVAQGFGLPVRVIDSERGSARKYSDRFAFEVLELEQDQSAGEYMSAIHEASEDGFQGTLIIDSLSHAWMGKGGALETVDRIAGQSRSGNSFMAWRDVTPLHNKLVDTILRCPLHVIVTLRVKTEYILEEGSRKGTVVPRKIGTTPVMRDGIEYEFDVVGDLDLQNQLVIGKTRCSELAGQAYSKAGKDVAKVLLNWAGKMPARPAPETRSLPAETKPAAPEPAQVAAPTPALSPEERKVWDEDLSDKFCECERNQVSLGPLTALMKRVAKLFAKPSKAFVDLNMTNYKIAKAAIEARMAAAQSGKTETAPVAPAAGSKGDTNPEWGFGGAKP